MDMTKDSRTLKTSISINDLQETLAGLQAVTAKGFEVVNVVCEHNNKRFKQLTERLEAVESALVRLLDELPTSFGGNDAEG